MRRRTEVVAVVEVADWAHVKERDERQRLAISVQHAEIAQLRMLLKEALAQLERIYLTTKSGSPEFRRLVARTETVLARSTLLANESETP